MAEQQRATLCNRLWVSGCEALGDVCTRCGRWGLSGTVGLGMGDKCVPLARQTTLAGQAAKPEASTEPIGETRSRRACETNELAGGAASCLWRNQATVVSGGLSTDPIGGIEVNDLFGARSREWSASWQCESEIGRCLWRVGHRRGEGERLPGKSFFWALPVCVSLRAQAFRFAPRECRRPGKAGRPPI